ncbi:MAG: purU [Pseudonocardiales bacterium]|nr:purU [Pseudonocardiales bacterium]
MTDAGFVLSLSCPDRLGIVHAVSSFLVASAGTIVQSQQYGDEETQLFFMRVHFRATDPTSTLDGFKAAFRTTATDFAMSWQMWPDDRPMKTLVLVSKLDHCLNYLLFETRSGAIPIEIVGIVSNHPDAQALADWQSIPFHHVPVTADTKAAAEDRVLALVEEHDVELVVLARYMQILSENFCRRMDGRIINIHHSFLPSFKGAKPYAQAHSLGVKLIGATAHYVTADLDEGPIIEQDVQRVDHSADVSRLVELGRTVESMVLARAVTWHAEHRVLRNGSRTVVLR